MGAGAPYAPPINSMHGMMNQAGPYPMGGNVANNSAGAAQSCTEIWKFRNLLTFLQFYTGIMFQ